MEATDTILPAGVHQHLSAQHIGAQEDLRVFDGAVHMALRREVDHNVRPLFLKQPIHQRAVGNVPLDEAEVGPFHGLAQRF